MLVEALDAHRVPLLDLLPVLRAVPAELDGARHLYHLRDTHFNVRGNRVAGTAIAGTQRRTRIFIENSHVHVDRIMQAITGTAPAWASDEQYANLEES